MATVKTDCANGDVSACNAYYASFSSAPATGANTFDQLLASWAYPGGYGGNTDTVEASIRLYSPDQMRRNGCPVLNLNMNSCALSGHNMPCNEIRECDQYTGALHYEFVLPGGPSGNVDILVGDPNNGVFFYTGNPSTNPLNNPAYTMPAVPGFTPLPPSTITGTPRIVVPASLLADLEQARQLLMSDAAWSKDPAVQQALADAAAELAAAQKE